MRALVAVAVSTLVLLAGAASAAALKLEPYDGANPFLCELQQLGTGVAFSDPRADPLCVSYDKTNQDIASLGILAFLANEPARVAAALDKCFYFQSDEWRGSVFEGGGLELYHWRGRYWFDRAHGAAGAYLEQVRIGGYGGDPRLVELAPQPLRSFLHPTGGGGQLRFEFDADPRCVAAVDTPAEADAIYADGRG